MKVRTRNGERGRGGCVRLIEVKLAGAALTPLPRRRIAAGKREVVTEDRRDFKDAIISGKVVA
jgi:hypothetical protein